MSVKPAHALYCRRFLSRGTASGFSTIELVVALVLLLLVSSVITLGVARSMSSTREVAVLRIAEQRAQETLDAMASDYSQLKLGLPTGPVSDDESCGAFFFDRKYTCFRESGALIVVQFAYMNSSGTTAAACDNTLTQPATDGYVGLCATATIALGSAATLAPVEPTWNSAQSVVYTRVVPDPGFPDEAIVRVSVSSPEVLPDGLTLFLSPDRGTPAFGGLLSAPVEKASLNAKTGVAHFRVGVVDGKPLDCSSESPCQVRFSLNGYDPARTVGPDGAQWGLYGSSARPGAGIIALPSQTTAVSVTIAPAPTLKPGFSANGMAWDAASGTDVCLWLLFDHGAAGPREAPLCFAGPQTQLDAIPVREDGQQVMYPVPLGTLTISGDAPSGMCVDASTGACTSWTWGLPDTITHNATSGSVVEVSAVWPVDTPAGGYDDPVDAWKKPRLGYYLYSVTGNPEDDYCPGQTCLAENP